MSTVALSVSVTIATSASPRSWRCRSPGIHQLLDRLGAVGRQVQPAAGLEVGERLRGVALADRLADLPVSLVALADDGDQLGVPADHRVDQPVPAARADRLRLLGIPQGADAGGPGGLKQ